MNYICRPIATHVKRTILFQLYTAHKHMLKLKPGRMQAAARILFSAGHVAICGVIYWLIKQ